MPYCQNCGQELQGTAKFCPNCGTPSTELTPQANTPESPAEAPQPAPAKPGLNLKVLLNLLVFLVSFGLVVYGIFIFISPSSTSHAAKIANKTKTPYTAAGLSFVGSPSWEATSRNDGGTYIEITGKIRASAWIGSPVYIKVTFYDKDGATLGSRADTISDLQAGETWSYKVIAYYDNISYFVIDGVTY